MKKYTVKITLRDKFFNLLQEKTMLISAISSYEASQLAENIASLNYPEVNWIKARADEIIS